MYFLEKAKTHNSLNGEVMSVKRAYELLGVAGKEHGELVRLRRRVIKAPARNDSSVTAFMDLKTQRTE